MKPNRQRSYLRGPAFFTIIATAGLACGDGSNAASTPLAVAVSNGTTLDSVPSWNEFKANSLHHIDGKEVYVVETDMFADNDDELWGFYDSLYLHPERKSIVNTVNGTDDVRKPTQMQYCFSPGSVGWSTRVCPTGGKPCYTSTDLPSTQTAINQAMNGLSKPGVSSWQQTTNVTFIYRQDLDGASCATPAVTFVVAPYDDVSAGTPGTASGPFPSQANQTLKVPASTGINRLLALHELGHTIGLRHEHINPAASPSCLEGDTHYRILTAFDTLSCMKYANCKTGNTINGTEISVLDGIGTRSLYGAPARWFPTYSAGLL